jgi:hypothetical protein
MNIFCHRVILKGEIQQTFEGHMNVLKWSRNTLIASLATALLALLLLMSKAVLPMPVSIIMLGAMITALLANLIYAFACAAAWIKWFRTRSDRRN